MAEPPHPARRTQVRSPPAEAAHCDDRVLAAEREQREVPYRLLALHDAHLPLPPPGNHQIRAHPLGLVAAHHEVYLHTVHSCV